MPGRPGPRPRPCATRVATQASASTSANSDACLVGTWKDIDQQVVDTSTGTPILFTGSGGMLTVNANGTFTATYDNVILTAHSGGVDYTAQLNGTNSGTWAVNGGQLVVNDESSNITEALTKNGVYAGSGKLTTTSISAAYTCSGNTVIETFAEGGGNHFVRVSSLPQAEEGPGSVS